MGFSLEHTPLIEGTAICLLLTSNRTGTDILNRMEHVDGRLSVIVDCYETYKKTF